MSTPDEFLDERRRLKWYVAGALAGIGSACAAIVFALATFATTGDVRAVELRAVSLEVRTSAVEERVTRAAAAVDEIQRERDFMRAQLWEIAKAVGAPRLLPPLVRK